MNPGILKSAPVAALMAAGAAMLAACSAPASVSPGVAPELKHSWEVNFNRGDAAAVAALYAPDAQLVMSGSETAKGPEAIRAVVEAMIQSGAKVHIESSQNVGAGDIAYVFGTYTVLDHEGGRDVERGSYVEVWRHQDGAWRISLDVNAAGPAVTTATPAAAAPATPK
jgi:uncharacterized protein (TIGR02246 family)